MIDGKNLIQTGVLIDTPFTQGQEKSDGKEKDKKMEPIKQNNVIRHYVTEVDTLIGLSFRYGVSTKSIRQLNRMPSDDVQCFSRLYIPKKGYDVSVIDIQSDDEDLTPPQNQTDTEKVLFQKRMLFRLRGQTGMSIEEATYYLTLYGYSYTDALVEYKGDLEFEKTTPYVPSKRCK